MSNDLEKIKHALTTKGAISLFADNMPSKTGKHAIEAAERFSKMLYTAVSQSESLQRCSVASLAKAGSIAASLDLDIDPRGLAYLVPYGGEAQFQIGYMGLIELAYRSGRIKAISAHCIFESEKDAVRIERKDGRFSVEHPFSYEMPTGEMIAVYATAEVEGLGPQTVVLRREEVEKFRNVSKAKNSPAWKDHYEAMAKKTAIRQLAKVLPKAILPEFSRAASLDEEQDFATKARVTESRITSESGSEPIDTQFEADGESGEDPEPTFLGDDEEDTKIKAQKQKDKLRQAEAEDAESVPGRYACRNPKCKNKGVVFTDPAMVKKGRTEVPQCPACFGTNIEIVPEDEAA